MKSLTQYLAESEKTYEFRLRSLNEISDEHMDRIESHMAKYNMESMSSPKKTIMHTPRGFEDKGAQEVYMYDIKTKLPATPNSLQEEIAGICGCSLGSMIVNNMLEAKELWDIEEETKDEESKSVLADADYSDSEKVDHSEHYGNEFVDKFVKSQPKGEHNKEYKV
jgi:hypothetical protein